MKFGGYVGGSLQMLRDGVWHSYVKDNMWLSFDALKVTHRVTEVLGGTLLNHPVYPKSTRTLDPWRLGYT